MIQDKLLTLRRRAGMSQQEVADAIGGDEADHIQLGAGTGCARA